MTPRAVSALTRWAKVTILGAVLLAADGAGTLLTGNALGLAPTYQMLVQALVLPLLVAAEKWLSWQESQP